MMDRKPIGVSPPLASKAPEPGPLPGGGGPRRQDDAGALHRSIFQAWACAFGSSKVVYLSGPITTGIRFVETVRAAQPPETAIRRNLKALERAAMRIRAGGVVVVDPSPLIVKHWSQDDYMELWTGLIERHAAEVRFMPGWQYSIGCAREFAHAIGLGVATARLDGSPIAADAGRCMIEAAAADLLDNDGAGRLRALGEALSATAATVILQPQS